MAGSTPLQQWRESGRWPECLDRIWQQLESRHGRAAGTREMIALIRTGLSEGWDQLIVAVEKALLLGVTDGAAVMHIMRMPDEQEGRRYALALSAELAQFDRPQLLIRDGRKG